MKKITLLFMMLAVFFGYAQTLPFDFEGTLHGFTGDGGPGITNGAGNDVLEVTAGVSDWDNVQVTFASPIDLSNAAENTLRFTIQSTTALPGEIHQHGVSFQGGGGALEANFQTVGQDVLNVELNFNAGLGLREKLVIFTDVGDLGGIAATPNVAGTNTASLSGIYIIDNMSLGFDPGTCSDGVLNNGEDSIDCGGPNCVPCATDVTPPAAFTAVLGAIGGSSVELLLNATDDSGADITYDITYDVGGMAQTTGASGAETPFVISGLTAETMYTFMVSASDAAGNPAANNAISVSATTTQVIAFPFDFEGSLQGFVNNDATVSNGAGNDVFEMITGASDWDSASVTFTDPIDLSDEFNNTLRFTIQSTTAAPGEIHQHGVSFQSDGMGSYEANIQTVGTDVLNVELNFNGGLGSRDRLHIFTDVGDLGGTSVPASQNINGMGTGGSSGTYIIDNITFGADPETCDDGILNNGETAIDCGGVNCVPCDTVGPTAFTATAGTASAFSVDLVLNATDDSAGTITYDISYNSGADSVQATGDSGVETTFSVPGLMENTAYTFEVSASDPSGNPAANNAITVMASTIADTSTDCAGFSSESTDGSFSIGYNYDFVTEANGTDVTVTFEVLDTDKAGLVGEVFIPTPVQFIGMTNNGSNVFTVTLTGYTTGDVITFSGRFPYAGGLVRTKEFTYTVGDDCSSPANDDCGSATMLTLGAEQAFDNTGSTDSGVATCFSGAVSDIWYSFVAPASGEVTITAGTGTQYALFTDCNTELSCNTSANTGLIAMATYYLAVTDDGTVTRAPGASTIKIDDTSTLSNSEFSLSQFSVFPNPTNNNWNVQGTQDVKTVVVFDVLGKQVLTLQPNTKDFVITSEALNSGLYFARIQGTTGTKTLKLIKK
ncbi:T9SS type A sorting domain-containing protein [Lacinutrix jangbogonensis]|uniref:T9SS type A sorting domain-containing protein n=1 Tax=Lacinutrix jangbogonensis TaxID=1469557 RepID=UPI00138E3287|nr:T9SS type A sorting domain-containing protein [Lacinutrix jangbogonensis]